MPVSRRPPWRIGVALLSLSLAGCATSGSSERATRSIALLLPDGCCAAGSRPHLDRLRLALERRGTVRFLRAEASAAASAPAPRVRAALRRAHDAYLRLKMELARRELEQALELAARSFARGLEPAELARIHLYLAAVAIAEHDEARVRAHAMAAARLAPALQPDPLVFGPPLRDALQRARGEVKEVTVTVVSTPAGAQTFWDGAGRGATPATLAQVALGEHLLRVEHPLYLPWQEAPAIRTATTIHAGLRPRPAPEVAAALRTHPELCAEGARLLGSSAVVSVAEKPDGGVHAAACGDARGLATSRLDPGATDADAERVAAALVGDAAPPPRHTIRRRVWIVPVILAGVALAVALPLALVDRGEGRGVRLELP